MEKDATHPTRQFCESLKQMNKYSYISSKLCNFQVIQKTLVCHGGGGGEGEGGGVGGVSK